MCAAPLEETILHTSVGIFFLRIPVNLIWWLKTHLVAQFVSELDTELRREEEGGELEATGLTKTQKRYNNSINNSITILSVKRIVMHKTSRQKRALYTRAS
jgi:hypothetical protein